MQRPQSDGDTDSQYSRECDEVPESGESKNEDQCAAYGEEKADESAAEGHLVHGDAGMPLFGHRTSQSVVMSIVLPIAAVCKRLAVVQHPGSGKSFRFESCGAPSPDEASGAPSGQTLTCTRRLISVKVVG